MNVRTLGFYTFNQNNSGGIFVFNEIAGITHYVIVQAADAREANYRAGRIGLYFDGYGDCSCCGDRWYEQWKDDPGTPGPEIYGKPLVDAMLAPYFAKWMGPDQPEVFVHYMDGRTEGFIYGGRLSGSMYGNGIPLRLRKERELGS